MVQSQALQPVVTQDVVQLPPVQELPQLSSQEESHVPSGSHVPQLPPLHELPQLSWHEESHVPSGTQLEQLPEHAQEHRGVARSS